MYISIQVVVINLKSHYPNLSQYLTLLNQAFLSPIGRRTQFPRKEIKEISQLLKINYRRSFLPPYFMYWLKTRYRDRNSCTQHQFAKEIRNSRYGRTIITENAAHSRQQTANKKRQRATTAVIKF